MRLVTPGRTFTLRLTIDGCCALEDRAGQSLDDLTVAVNRGRMTALRWLLWAALQPYHADAASTEERVGEILDAAGGREQVRLLLAHFLKLNADEDAKAESKGEKAKPDDRPGSVWRRFYLDAREMGIPSEVFWNLSLREWRLEMASSRQAQQHHWDRTVSQAWWIAALVWQKKLPALETLIGKKVKASGAQDWREMKAYMERFTQAMTKGQRHGEA